MVRTKQMVRLTKTVVEGIQPDPAKRLIVWDSIVPNFGVRVTPKGARTYMVLYTHKGRQRWSIIGPHGPLTVDQARDSAKGIVREAAGGKDPAGERQRARKIPTLETFFTSYLSDYARVHKKASSVTGDKTIFEKHLKPALGAKRLDEITRGDVARFHAERSATPVVANRCLALLSKMHNLAVEWGVLDPAAENPTRFQKKYPERGRRRYLGPDELKRLGEALRTIEAGAKKLPATRAAVMAIRLILLTGCRRGEVLNLRWAEVDLPAGMLRLSDSKTGKKDVVLNQPAAELLAGLKKDPSGFVIPGRKAGAPMVELKKTWARACALASLEDLHIHDLRHSYASFGVGLGATLPVIGALLGHTQSRTTSRYAHLADDPLRAAADSIGAAIMEAMGPGAEVVDIQAGGEGAAVKEVDGKG